MSLALNGIDKKKIYDEALKMTPDTFPNFREQFEAIPELKWEDLKTSGYVVHTLCAAFWGLLHTKTFEDALIEVVNRGDDADTCGAVTGALCGAYYGVDNIPTRWRETILEGHKIESLVKKLVGSSE